MSEGENLPLGMGGEKAVRRRGYNVYLHVTCSLADLGEE